MKKDAPEATKSIVNLSLTGKQSKLLEFALYIVSKSLYYSSSFIIIILQKQIYIFLLSITFDKFLLIFIN